MYGQWIVICNSCNQCQSSEQQLINDKDKRVVEMKIDPQLNLR